MQIFHGVLINCLFSLQIIIEKTMVWPSDRSSSALDYSSPKTLVLFMRNVSSQNDFKFFLWNEGHDELFPLKWCPIISPLLLMSYFIDSESRTILVF